MSENGLDFNNVTINPFSDEDDFSDCNFKEDDETDPLGVNDFIHNRALKFNDNNLSVVYVLRYNQEIAAFYTASMGGLKIAELREGEMIEEGPAKEYPALLLGNMGVEKRFRKKGLGSFICDICVGLARTLSRKVGCRYVILLTIRNKLEFYQKCEFVASEKISNNGKLWMYRRIIARHVVRPVSDSLHISDSVSATKNPT